MLKDNLFRLVLLCIALSAQTTHGMQVMKRKQDTIQQKTAPTNKLITKKYYSPHKLTDISEKSNEEEYKNNEMTNHSEVLLPNLGKTPNLSYEQETYPLDLPLSDQSEDFEFKKIIEATQQDENIQE